MRITLKLILKIILLLSLCTVTYGQHQPGKERGDPKVRTKGQMEGNKVRTTIFNHGQTGRTGGEFPITEQTPYEWPKNTGQVYLALTGIFVGGEVSDDNGDIQRIIDVMNYRTSPEGNSWNFEPIPGYFNEDFNEVANSLEPDSWPDFWPDRLNDVSDPGWRGSWNGFFGKNIFNADQEMFYRASDDRYSRYANYFPDTTDFTRKGMGILLEVRVLAWSQVLVEDVVYILHNILNDGTKDISKVGVTIWYADFVGGNGDSNDDISEFELLEDIAWTRDNDHRAPEFGSDPVGIVAVTFLETPGNAVDRIDNDGDGEILGPKVTEEMLVGESDDSIPDTDPRRTNGIDDNRNGLIDENKTHIQFGIQEGVTYADRIDQNMDGEPGSPLVTQEMVDLAAGDFWKRWPTNPDGDAIQEGEIHLVLVESDDIGMAFKDNLDNNGNGELNSPFVTQEMIDAAATDPPYFRYVVPITGVILYNLKQENLDQIYADGIDNDQNGAVDENIDENIDDMVDEARNNGIDDDGDWNVMTDDVGLDGVPDTGDPGEGDGQPTSGAGTGLPGEPNIDVTDVSETDQIGISNADYIPAGGLNINSDATMWFNFMIPGKFFDPLLVVPGEYDLFVSSSLFPLKSGQTEPFSIAVILANGPVPDPGGEFRKEEIRKKRVRAQETYDNDYRFANAPLTPTVTAIAGDNKVTLYWDDAAESSFDTFIDAIGGEGFDFEGYRIYRSSDPAFLDALKITNAFGTKVFNTPLIVFDLIDGIEGLDPIGFEGVHYYLGEDSGLQHSWVDSTVQNGFTYYYAVVSYDFGFAAGDIIPSESPIRISLKADGTAKIGSNVAIVTPEAPVAGFIASTLGELNLIEGTTTGDITYDVIDPNKLKNGHVYKITFEDTLIAGAPGKPDTLTTKNYSLTDSTSNMILVDKRTDFDIDDEQPITDGFKLFFRNETRVERNEELTKWNNPDIPEFQFEKFIWRIGGTIIRGEERPNDYLIAFDEVGIGTSTELTLGSNTFPSIPVNFQVYNLSIDDYIDFAFIELDTTLGGPGQLSAKGAAKDRIVFMESDSQGSDSLIFTWWFFLDKEPDSTQFIPQTGDTATIFLKKPFLSPDIFRFTAHSEKVDNQLASEQLKNIKVVPNPYMATASWEAKNPYQSGRGPRSIHFIHLPKKCTIRIFTVNGDLVDVIEHDSPLNDGTADWDLLTLDNLSISYGIYVYHVDAPGVGEIIGKFAVIK